MPIALAGTKVEIRSPRRLEARPGSEVAIALAIELPEPWLERLRPGRSVRSIDGQGSGMSLAFECDRPVSVPALVSGNAQTSDTRIDVHTPQGFPDAGAGLGHEVTLVAPGGFTVLYGHLARGSGKSGSVKAGAPIGTSGNTGRCADGCGRSFVRIAFEGTRSTLDEIFEPITAELFLDGKPAGKAATLPSGETRISDFAAGKVKAPRDRGKGTYSLEVKLLRRNAAIATLREELVVHV